MPEPFGLAAFRSIWFDPRATIRRIVETDPRRHTRALVTLLSFYALLDFLAARVPVQPPAPVASFLSLGGRGSVMAAAALSPLGIPSLPPMGMLFRWVGGWFGGVASRQDVIAVLTWGSLPLLTTWTITWIAQAVWFGGVLFTAPAPAMEDHLGIVLSLALLQLTGSTWSAVAITLGLAEINRIPVSKAIATVVAGTAILVVPLLIVLLVAVAGLVLVLMANM